MAVQFRDYYQVLGVGRNATQPEVQRAYRKLARQFHPDVNKAKDAEARFKELTEAYEVLKDPEKRGKYDQLGANWKEGQSFTPPPDWDAAQGPGNHGDGGGFRFHGSGAPGDFSDFFEAFFGRGAAGGRNPLEEMLRQGGDGGRGAPGSGPGFQGQFQDGGGQTIESELTISLAEACSGGTRQLRLQADGAGAAPPRTLEVKIPKGVTDGSTIRLKGQGVPGGRGAPGRTAGDLLLHLHIAPDPRFELEGRNLVCRLPVSPWEAALGAKVPVTTLDGQVTVSIPPGSQSGRKLRLRGKGLPGRGSEASGDLLIRIEVAVPAKLTDRERELFTKLKEESKFDPRGA